MPQKIKYNVLGCTGEADGYPSNNLEEQSPTARGWQTPRFCVYPQEVIFKLHKSVSVKKLQILAHQYMIPTKIEFYISHDDSPQSFKKLGYIYLSSNEKTGFKSRELKSVHIDSFGQYLRLVVHKNHINKFNLYNQVSLIAFNVIGDYQKRDGNILDFSHMSQNETVDKYMNDAKPDYISPMDDLAFDMYQDPEVAQIIRKLDNKKHAAVVEENFDTAKKIKQAIADLQKVGEKLGRYELEKRKAIEDEDYDLAKSKKAQMQEYRLKVYQQLKNHGLMDELRGHNHVRSPEITPQKTNLTDNAPNSSAITPQKSQFSSPQNVVYREEHNNSINESHGQSPGLSSPIHSNHTSEQFTYLSQQYEESQAPLIQPEPPVVYDERVIPALNKQRDKPPEQDPFSDEAGGPVSPRDVPGSEPEAMSEKHIREASSAIDIFGLELVSGAYSKTFSFREDALLAVYKKLKEMPLDTSKEEAKDTHKAAVFLVKKTIRDKVQSVCSASLKVLELLLKEYIPQHKLGKGDVTFTLNKVLTPLFQKTGETAARSRNLALNFMEEMAQYPIVRSTNLVPAFIVQPFPKDTAQRLALSRVQIAGKLIEKFSVQPPSLSVEHIMKMCNSGLEHNSGAVRDAATSVIYQTYKIAGQPVKHFLPPDEPATRKNTLYRHIFDKFDEMDGKPTQAQLKAQRELDEKKKKEEINALQDQIHQLKNMNAEVAAKGGGQSQKKQNPKTKPANAVQDVPVQDDPDEDSSAYLENMCIFCSERDDTFNEQGLDLHYWKHCPMLKRCEHCKQVVEIAGYSEHLLSECEKHKMFGKCPRCTEAIPEAELQQHIAAKTCKATQSDQQNHCPMCHNNIPFGEEAWKDHLMGTGPKACPANTRRQESINRLKAKKAIKKPLVKGKKSVPPQRPARKR